MLYNVLGDVPSKKVSPSPGKIRTPTYNAVFPYPKRHIDWFGSAVLAQLVIVTNRQTDTDRRRYNGNNSRRLMLRVLCDVILRGMTA